MLHRRSNVAVQTRRAATLALASAALIGTGIWVGYNVNLLPVDASSNASVYDDLFKVLFSIGAMLFLGIAILLVYSLVRFRRTAADTGDGLAIEGNLPLEILWTAIPAVVVLFIGIYSYDIYERMGGMTSLHDHSAMAAGSAISGQMATPDMAAGDRRFWGGISPAIGASDGGAIPLPVEVTAMQFAFIFHYPDGDITSGELHVPVGRPVELRMEARDVIHAFWVPQFRLKQDVIPGQPTLLSFTPTRAGTYPIICAELCGPYHGGMRSSVVVQEADVFEAWVQQNRQPATST
jgi:cytochrome c oxidase subunit 2